MIEFISPKNESIDGHLAALFHKNRTMRRSWYRDPDTGLEFWDLVGSVAWPERAPGFALIVGVLKGENDTPDFLCVAEIESPSVHALLRGLVALKAKWGCPATPELLHFFSGDYSRMATEVMAFNQRLAKAKRPQLIIAPPPEIENPNRFEVYLNAIARLLLKNKKGNKRLNLGECNRLRLALTNLSDKAATERKEKDCPAATALGYICTRLMLFEPWMVEVAAEKFTWTRWEEEFAKDFRRTQEEIITDLFYANEDEEADDGLTRSTR